MKEPTIENLLNAGWKRVMIDYRKDSKVIDLGKATKEDEREWFIAMYKPGEVGEYHSVLVYAQNDEKDYVKLNMRKTTYFDKD